MMDKYEGPKLLKKGVGRWVVVYARELKNPVLLETEEYKYHKARRVFNVKMHDYLNLLMRGFMIEAFKNDQYVVKESELPKGDFVQWRKI